MPRNHRARPRRPHGYPGTWRRHRIPTKSRPTPRPALRSRPLHVDPRHHRRRYRQQCLRPPRPSLGPRRRQRDITAGSRRFRASFHGEVRARFSGPGADRGDSRRGRRYGSRPGPCSSGLRYWRLKSPESNNTRKPRLPNKPSNPSNPSNRTHPRPNSHRPTPTLGMGRPRRGPRTAQSGRVESGADPHRMRAFPPASQRIFPGAPAA